jgi:hypothetical protein
MRQFGSPGFKIWSLSVEAKVLYTAFGLFALLAYVVSVLYYEDLMGFGVAGARRYYAGGPAPSTVSAPATATPRMNLPDEAAAPMAEPISYRHLLEVTHFHLFTVPVFLLIVAHLFMLTGIRPQAKLAWIASSVLAAFAHLGAPWWVRYTGTAAWLMPLSGAAMFVTFSGMTGYSIVAMWRGPARQTDSSPP